ncbi:MAG: phospholipid carrier-dependent glycosyltransferase [Planctomycetes bacterium]|nr:phospholipid carrier-dependent glycosyltransferase [Planctomycetota bacterium]
MFVCHNATDYVYSDMMGFFVRAQGLVHRPGQESIIDIVLPPGGHMFFAFFYRYDLYSLVKFHDFNHRTWWTAISAQFVLSSLVPLLIAAIGYELYGRRTALVALILSSLYFPFIHYASHFMSEGPFLFCMVLSFWLLIRSIRVRSWWVSAPVALVAGVGLGASMGLKPVVVLPALLIFCWLGFTVCRHWWWAWRHRADPSAIHPGNEIHTATFYETEARGQGQLVLSYDTSGPGRGRPILCGAIGNRLALVMLCSGMGLISIVVPLIQRATKLNEGRFCFISTNGAVTTLMGHFGESRLFQFRDPKRPHLNFDSGYPVAYQKGYHQDVVMPFGAYDAPRCLDAAWKWSKENPLDAVQLSSEHVHDLFYGSVPWPASYPAPGKPWPTVTIAGKPIEIYHWMCDMTIFMKIFWICILLPAVIFLVVRVPRLFRPQGPGLGDALLALPILGLMIGAFVALGEPRYRIPFDAFLIILAARAYTLGAHRTVSQLSGETTFDIPHPNRANSGGPTPVAAPLMS